MVEGNGRNQFRQYAGQNAGNKIGYNAGQINGLIVVLGIANQNVNQNENGNVVAARAKGNGDIDKIEEVNANCILMDNLQQASTSGTNTDKAPVYDSDGSAEMIDYALWEVIENENTASKTIVVEGVEKVMPPTTAEEKA
ncbi:hypothetical protein Tco_0332546 [Tanacetum coccineum]